MAETAIEKANMLNNFFQSMFVKDDGILVTSDQKSITNEYIDIVVTRQGVLNSWMMLMSLNLVD